MDTSSQVSDEHLGIGDNTWVSVAEFEQEYDNKPFFTAVPKFYVSTIQKILSEFPFGDALSYEELGHTSSQQNVFFSL